MGLIFTNVYTTVASGINNIMPKIPNNLPPKNTDRNIHIAGRPEFLPTNNGYIIFS